MDCGTIPNCTSIEAYSDDSLRSFRDSEAQESQTTVTENELAKLVETIFRIDMSVKFARNA